MAPAFTRPKPAAPAIASDGPGLSSRHSSAVRAAFGQRGICSGLVEAVCDGNMPGYLHTHVGQAELRNLSTREGIEPYVQAFSEVHDVAGVVTELLLNGHCAADLKAIVEYQDGCEMIRAASRLPSTRLLALKVIGNLVFDLRNLRYLKQLKSAIDEVTAIFRERQKPESAPVSQAQPVV